MLSNPPNLKLIWKTYKLSIIGLLLLTFIYLFIRIYNLLILPLFVDEAIYIRWSQVMRAEPTLRFLPLTDGKQPLFMWLTIPFQKLISDPLYAGRLVSVFAGLGSMLGIFFLSNNLLTYIRHAELASLEKGGVSVPQTTKQSDIMQQYLPLIATALYVISPYHLFFDRMALADSLLNMFGIWAMVFAIHNLRNPRLDLTIITGATLGAAWLTKSPAIFFLILLPALLIIKLPKLLSSRARKTIAKSRPLLSSRASRSQAIAKNDDERSPTTTYPLWQLTRLLISWGISAAIAFAIYNILRLGPEFHQIAIRNGDYLYPFSEVMSHPLDPLVRNLKDVLGFYWILLTPAICIPAIYGIYVLIRKHTTLTLWLLAWNIGPLLAQTFLAQNVTARYFLFTTTPILIFAAFGLNVILSEVIPTVIGSTKSKNPSPTATNHFLQKFIVHCSLFIIFLILFYTDYRLLTNPESAHLPQIERSGYLEEWTAGQGIPEIVSYLKTQSKDHTLVIGTEGEWGSIPSGLAAYFNQDPRVTILHHSHVIDQVPPELYNSLAQHQVYLVFNNERLHIEDPSAQGLKLIMEFPKATRQDGTYQTTQLFQVASQPTTLKTETN